jgi:hypothetical protein
VLAPRESIVASCFEAGYYTFATGIDASKRMFAETGSLHAERAAIRRGAGPTDLELINGQSLAWIDPDIGVGADLAQAYFGTLARRRVVDAVTFDNIRREVLDGVTLALKAETRTVASGQDPQHVAIMDEAVAACTRVLQRGIFVAPAQAGRLAARHFSEMDESRQRQQRRASA